MGTETTQIAILGAECAMSHSQQVFLEARGYPVNIVDPEKTELSRGFHPEDIIILNIGYDCIENYVVLGKILHLDSRPKLVLVLYDSEALGVDDDIYGGPSIVLNNPDSPQEILEAVRRLSHREDCQLRM